MKQLFRKWLGIDKLELALDDLEYEVHNHEHGAEPPPPNELELSFYVDEQRRQHPALTDEQLAETYWATAEQDTRLYDVSYDKEGAAQRNDEAQLILEYAGGDNEVKAGQQVLVYRWAFQVDGGNVRASVYQPMYMVNIKHFTKPTE